MPSLGKRFNGLGDVVLKVKLNLKRSLLSWILAYDAVFCTKWAKGGIITQSSRKQTPLYIKIHFHTNIYLPINSFSLLLNGIGFILAFIVCYYTCLLCYLQFAAQFFYCSNSLNFQLKIKCHTTRQNVPLCRKRCTG